MSKLVGLVGWRGMVGSVLMDRMQAERDFDLIEPVFFSTSNAGAAAPAMAKNETTLLDGMDLNALKACDIIITCTNAGKPVFEVLKQFMPQLGQQERGEHGRHRGGPQGQAPGQQAPGNRGSSERGSDERGPRGFQGGAAA